MTKLVHDVLSATERKVGNKPALRVKRNGTWQTWTWTSYARDCRRTGRALIQLGLQPGRGIVIIGNNSPEWLIADVGAILAGGMPAGIYTTSSPEQVRYISAHCEAEIAFADNAEQTAKFLAVREHLPALRAVIQMHGEPESSPDASLRVLSWNAFLALAAETPEAELNARIQAQKPDDVCTLIYTSGTTGDPKAVMITHTNLTWTAHNGLVAVERDQVDEVIVSYLPLSHIAEQLMSIHGPMSVGATVYFAESFDKLAETLAEVRPTMFVGVPRVWEKIQAKISAVGAHASPLQKTFIAWVRKQALKAGYAEQGFGRSPLVYPLLKRFVLNKVRARLGLDRAAMCITSAAPISKATLDFFLSLGIPLLEVYGMSECTGPATYCRNNKYRTGKCGLALPGCELKIAEDGEVLTRGKHVFKGYLKDDIATRNAIDKEGWLHTGDIGTLDKDGFLQITDRKKDLLITAGGENIAPQLLEGMLKSIPVIEQAVIIGDRRKYLTALITLDEERLETELKLAGSPAKTAAQAAQCPAFQHHLEAQIQEINAKLARVQTIKHFTIIPHAFSIETGELTPTLKVKRKIVDQKYQGEIEAMYVAIDPEDANRAPAGSDVKDVKQALAN